MKNKRFRISSWRMLRVGVLLVCFLLYQGHALAVDENGKYTPAELQKLGIIFVNDGQTPTTCSGPSFSTNTQASNNLDYAGRTILTDVQLQQIQANQPFYEKSAQASSIPWQMIAVIHLREHGLQRDNPSNGQGVYQFVNKNGGPYPTGPISDEEFQRQTDLAAEFIKTKVGSVPLTAQNADISAVKDTFFGYNGRAGVYKTQAASLGFSADTQGFEGSPYVMNKADAPRDPEQSPTTWGQIKTDGGGLSYPANNDYGAFIDYGVIAGIQSGSSCSTASGDSAQKIVSIAQQELALWENNTLKPGTDFHKYSQGRDENWCADFTSWVYNQAGAPLTPNGEGNVPGVDGIRQIGIQKGTYHDKVGYTPQPGDAVIRLSNGAGHVNIVISVTGQTMHVIGGNQGGGGQGFQASKVSGYDDTLSNPEITGYVSPF